MKISQIPWIQKLPNAGLNSKPAWYTIFEADAAPFYVLLLKVLLSIMISSPPNNLLWKAHMYRFF
jgi:hypothetical protein